MRLFTVYIPCIFVTIFITASPILSIKVLFELFFLIEIKVFLGLKTIGYEGFSRSGAANKNRTYYLFITNEVHYQCAIAA